MSSIQESVTVVASKWDDLYAILMALSDEGKLDLDDKYSSVPFTISELNKAIGLSAEFISGFFEQNSNISDVLLNRLGPLNSLSKQLVEITKHIDAALIHLDPIKDKPQDASVADGNLHIQIPQSGKVNLASHIQHINNALDSALTSCLSLGILFEHGPPTASERYIEKLQETYKKVSKLYEELKGLHNQANTSTDQVKGNAETVGNLLNDTKQAKQQIDEINANANEIKGELGTKSEQVREIANNAQSLQSQISEYEGKFEAFDNQLEERNKQFEKFRKDTKEVDEKRSEDEREIERITDKANEMIKGATVAGMASGLEDTRQEYKRRLAWAGCFYFGAIGILFVVAASIAAYAIPGTWFELVLPDWMMGDRPKYDANINSGWGFISRLVLLVPAIWVTRFIAERYRALSDLEQHYAFKSAMARSVEGFKKEAPNYQEEITALIFTDLRERPMSYSGDGDNSTNRSRREVGDSMLSSLKEKIGSKIASK